ALRPPIISKALDLQYVGINSLYIFSQSLANSEFVLGVCLSFGGDLADTIF
ncbi:unnamed protein product, partial [marine sediment metagenome]